MPLLYQAGEGGAQREKAPGFLTTSCHVADLSLRPLRSRLLCKDRVRFYGWSSFGSAFCYLQPNACLMILSSLSAVLQPYRSHV